MVKHCPSLRLGLLLFNIIFKVVANSMTQEKEINGKREWKVRSKTVIIYRWYIHVHRKSVKLYLKKKTYYN